MLASEFPSLEDWTYSNRSFSSMRCCWLIHALYDCDCAPRTIMGKIVVLGIGKSQCRGPAGEGSWQHPLEGDAPGPADHGAGSCQCQEPTASRPLMERVLTYFLLASFV